MDSIIRYAIHPVPSRIFASAVSIVSTIASTGNTVPHPQATTTTDDSYRALRKSLYQRLVAAPTPDDAPAALTEAQHAIDDRAIPQVIRTACVSFTCFHHINAADFDRAATVLDNAPSDLVAHERFGLDIAYMRAVILNRKGALADAMAILEDVHASAKALGISTTLSRASSLMASLCEVLGDLSRAERLYAETFTLKEDVGDRRGIAVAAFNFALFLDRQGLYDRALEYYHRAADIEESFDDVANLTLTMSHLAVVYARLHRADVAHEKLAATNELLERSAPVLTAVAALVNMATAYSLLNERQQQRVSLLRALEMIERHGVDSHRVNIQLELADLALAEGAADTSELFILESLHLLEHQPDALLESRAQLRRAKLLVRRHQWHEAVSLATNAIQSCARLGALVELGEAVEVLAAIVADVDATPETKAFLRDSLQQYRRLTDERETRRYALLMSRMGAEHERKDAEIERLRTIELAAANARLETMNAELVQLAAEKDEFLAIAAHDLRNPLFEIRAAITTIVHHVHELPPNDVRTICRDVLSAVTRMMATVTTFLAMAQSSSKVSLLAHESVSLTYLAHRAEQRHAARARERNVRLALESDGECWASGDATLIDAILDNLLSNAIKYTATDSVVTIRVRRDGPSVDVIDEGPGVPANEVDKLFTKFPAISTRPADTDESLGLGLYLAQRMAQKMGASITYRPHAEHDGSCFTLQLPAVVDADATPQQ